MSTPDVIKIAILAVGGQGGGVLTGWIVALAEANGWRVQSTAVAGVAQRTGATIYYVEMCPMGPRTPVLALAPAAGDVDILIAAELMEAGRAVLRGFVTPDRTTLIASTHRIHAVSEKIVPGDGQAPEDRTYAAMERSAKHVIAEDFQRIAVQAGSVISASLFGALARAEVLPFPRQSFVDVIRGSGRGAEASFRAFEAALTDNRQEAEVAATGQLPPAGPESLVTAWSALEARVSALPVPVQRMAITGLRHVVDFQDLSYGEEYLDRLDRFVGLDMGAFELSVTAAKYLANAMAYDDVVRVADLKTRRARFARVREDMRLGASDVAHITEFMHPRIDEACGTLPAPLGAWIEARPRLAKWLDRRINKGRKVRTSGLFWFAVLYVVAGLRRWRRGTYRHRIETRHLDDWIDLAIATASEDRALAAEVLACRRLIKGYADTRTRGESKFDAVLQALPLLKGRNDSADVLRRLREAALQDEHGNALETELEAFASAGAAS